MWKSENKATQTEHQLIYDTAADSKVDRFVYKQQKVARVSLVSKRSFSMHALPTKSIYLPYSEQ